ncbi:MAG: YggS family pyridoxal phosphate-dependent enzyme [Acidobacteria bacterium]|nr:YggS family pyridoxal phosphate-dependent enzyme [Acidobacteriota bacterium]
MIAGRLTEVRSRIATAARSVGRDPSSIQLIAVSKTCPLDAVREAYAAGQRDFGENRVQEALEKIHHATEPDIRWHLLGHLQTNKARKTVGAFASIQSVDSDDLLLKLERAALDEGIVQEVLLQVAVTYEATKFGVPPDDMPRLFEIGTRLEAVRIVGVMTIPPPAPTPEGARPWFRRLRELCDGWQAAGVPPAMLRELSMGMSGDFEVAIQEGATMVRVGTAIFGSRG